MAVTGLRDVAGEPYAGGSPWDLPGRPAVPYEWVRAVADVAVDPDLPANSGVVDLDLAPRDGDGLVHARADLRLLAPAAGGNRKLLVVIPNRGMLGGVPFSVGAPLASFGAPVPDPGDGFLLQRGWSVAWVGWQWDVLRGEAALGITVPEVPVDPEPMRLEFRPDEVQADHPLSDSALFFRFADYPTADLHDPDAVLLVRDAPDADPVALPRDTWAFTDEVTVALEGGFQPFRWYTLVYRSRRNPVAGLGLLAVRDVVSYLRRERDVETALGFGVSQSGRFLRQFLHEARNLDERGDVVFDGVFAHIAGGRRGEFNHRYAQPSLTHPLGSASLPPYDSAGLLAAQRAAGGVPKLMLTNTSAEYWRGDGALVHVDAASGEDLPEDPDTRTYFLRGADHLGAMPLKDMMPAANPTHDHDVQPVLRALFLALDEWVADGVDPPDSRIPRRRDGTLVERGEVLKVFAAAAGTASFAVPSEAALPVTREPIAVHLPAAPGMSPLRFGASRPALVSGVDGDGNETAGVALPVVAEPVAAYTGWNPRRPVPGLPATPYEFLGSRLPLLSGRALPARDAYERAVRASAAGLVADRFLLGDDVELTVAEALRAYDAATGAG